MGRVIIGMDPHKYSATIEVIDARENVLAQGRFGTDSDGYRAMLTLGRRYPHRIWAVEGCNGIGRHIAQRLVADGETVLDVPAKLSARARVFATGQGRKTDPVDAHSMAVAALRTKGLRLVGAHNSDICGELAFLTVYAARPYSLISPLRIGFRRIRRCSSRSTTVAGGCGGDRSRARCGRFSL